MATYVSKSNIHICFFITHLINGHIDLKSVKMCEQRCLKVSKSVQKGPLLNSEFDF